MNWVFNGSEVQKLKGLENQGDKRSEDQRMKGSEVQCSSMVNRVTGSLYHCIII